MKVITAKKYSNESINDVLIRLFGTNWRRNPTVSLITWSNISEYVESVIVDGEEIYVQINSSRLPNIFRWFKQYQ